MDLHLQADQDFGADPDTVFALALDAARFPEFFTGFGPIPAVRQITAHAPPAVGSTRELINGDGSRLHERITALDAPRHHAYTLTGLRPPLAWLVRAGHANWRFTPTAHGTHVRWQYRWTLTSPLAWPLAAPLLRVFMRGAMARCLAAMAAALADAPARALPPHIRTEH
ncbi:SRPBCC family protein [Agrilutibacter solisilvae]|uniref:SRPBCC family protein n=1 Tax=Agrilutibacter solisilvae TaxID=2763317 RepID=A0A974Y246_9GAMM|nr:SRPBCC family protein [Lysobacter solisilvae]QSX79143.1 SRPBCC family protein [Lysobacter solisilvae]